MTKDEDTLSGMPSLLFISPVSPDPSGTGIAQRAFHTLSVLREHRRVDLLVTASAHPPTPAAARLVDRVLRLPPSLRGDPVAAARMLRHRMAEWGFGPYPALPEGWYRITGRRLRAARRAVDGKSYAVLHAFRLGSAPFAWACAEASPGCRLQLDLDEAESRILLRVAALQRRKGERRAARRSEAQGRLLEKLEERWLSRFERIYVSSDEERSRLEEALRIAGLRVVPNVYPLPEQPPPEPALSRRLVFMGSFGYYPNRDAVEYFLGEIAPHLSEKSDFRLACVGYGLDDSFRARLSASRHTEIVGRVEEVAPWYRTAAAAVVPLRAGGGTRIKILEAFAHGCPVVSTPLGAEGLAVRHGRELLLADDPETFAGHCLRLLREPELGRALAADAHRFLSDRHAPAVLREALHG